MLATKVERSDKATAVCQAITLSNYGVNNAHNILKLYARHIQSTDKSTIFDGFYDYVLAHPLMERGIFRGKDNVAKIHFFIDECVSKKSCL